MHAPATTPELGRYPEPDHHFSPPTLLLLHRDNNALFHSYFCPPSAARVTTLSSPPFSAPHRPPKSAGRSRRQPYSTPHPCTTSPAHGLAAPPPGVLPPLSPETIRSALPMSCFPPSSPPESAARRTHLRGTPSPPDHDSPDTLPVVHSRCAAEPPPLLRYRRRSHHRSPSPHPAIIATVRLSHAVHPTPPFVPRSATFTHPTDSHPYSRPFAGTEAPPPMTAPSVSHPPSSVAVSSANRLLPSSPPHHAPSHLLSGDFFCAPQSPLLPLLPIPPETHTPTPAVGASPPTSMDRPPGTPQPEFMPPHFGNQNSTFHPTKPVASMSSTFHRTHHPKPLPNTDSTSKHASLPEDQCAAPPIDAPPPRPYP